MKDVQASNEGCAAAVAAAARVPCFVSAEASQTTQSRFSGLNVATSSVVLSRLQCVVYYTHKIQIDAAAQLMLLG
jgi:ABC-type molybdate transport system substrate-binding protein